MLEVEEEWQREGDDFCPSPHCRAVASSGRTRPPQLVLQGLLSREHTRDTGSVVGRVDVGDWVGG